MANISQNVNIEVLEKLPDGTYKRKYPKTRADDGTTFDEHLEDKANPHNTNKSDVGLSNVDNLSAASIRSGTTKTDVGLSNVDNVKQMPISGGTFTGISKAQNNTSHTVAQIRNVIFSTLDADASSMSEGDMWIKYT